MLAVIQHGRDVTPEKAAEILQWLLEGREALVEANESNEAQLLRDILNSLVRVSLVDGDRNRSAELSVAQLLDDEKETYAKELEARGVKLIKHPLGQGDISLFLVPNIVRDKLLAGTHMGRSRLDQLLRRLPGAEWKQQRFGGKNQRLYGVLLPWPDCLRRLEQQDRKQDSKMYVNTGE